MRRQMTTMTKIECGGMGATENWFRNNASADKNGFAKEDRCAHCGKGMLENTGWLARYVWQDDAIIAFDATDGEIIRLGNECVKNWMKYNPELKSTHFAKVGA